MVMQLGASSDEHGTRRNEMSNDALREAAEQALLALRRCYDVESYPGDGDTVQDRAITELEIALAASKPEPQKPGVWNCTFEHIRDIGVVVTSAASKPEPQAQATNEHTEHSERAEFTPDPLEQIIDNYVAEYEFNDGEAFHAPTDVERFMIKDAIMGLITDQDFDAYWGRVIDEQAELKAVALLAADKAGGEVVAYLRAETTTPEYLGWGVTTADDPNAVPVYDHPHPQPSALPDDVVKDAERYRALRDKGHGNTSRRPMAWIATGSLMDGVSWVNGEKADIAVDAMLKEGK